MNQKMKSNKSKIAMITLMALGAWCLVPGSAFAAPERMQISKPERKAAKKTAKETFKNIDLKSIADPEARKAVTEIAKMLELA